MRSLWAFGWLACAAVGAQTRPVLDVPCKLELTDVDQDSNPMGSVAITIRAADGPMRVTGKPDRDGNVVLRRVPEGRYALDLAFAGRILTFTAAAQHLNPLDFELREGAAGPLHIVVSLKVADLTIEVHDLPTPIPTGAFVALLFPADPYLALNHAKFTYAVREPEVEAGSLTPGKYLLFIVESRFSNDLGRAEVREALKDRATPVEVLPNGETRIVSSPMDADTVQHAIDAASHAPVAHVESVPCKSVRRI